jgi:hypothetical protein
VTPSQISALRVLGLIVTVIGGVFVLAAVIAFVCVVSVTSTAHLAPHATARAWSRS